LNTNSFNIFLDPKKSEMTKLQSKQNKLTSRRAVVSSAQISGSPNIESLKFTGYDASDGITLLNHDGTGYASANNGDGTLAPTENVVVYLQSNSVGKLTLSEVRFGGTVYNYTSTGPAQGSYEVLTRGPNTILTSTSAEIQPGQQVSVILQLDENIKNGRDTQMKLTTANGAVFVGTVIAGQQSG
jgi:hypothetical protein